MEAKKIDIWVIILAVIMYLAVNLFVLFPKEAYFENMIMLSLLFATLLLSYFIGMVVALGMGAVVIFFYGSYTMYGNVVLGNPVESHVYYWLVFIPAAAVIAAMIGSKVRLLQEENAKMKRDYSDFVTVDEITGLNNGKVLYSVMNQYMGLSRRYQLPLSLMIVKIMYYDDILAIVGHTKMKDIIKSIGKQLVQSTRTEDSGYMLEDGRTFALLLFGDGEGAQVVKRRMKESIRKYNLENSAKSVSINLELKIGIAQYREEQDILGMRKAAEKDMEYDV